MKLSEYAKKHSIGYEAARRQFQKGLIPGAYQMSTGTIVVPDNDSKITLVVDESVWEAIEDLCESQGWIVQHNNITEIKINGNTLD